MALRWRTAAEDSILGFDVIRDGGGQSVRVNAGLIRAKAFATGASYVLVDRTARRSTPYTYRLETVTLGGARVVYATSSISAR